MYKLEIFKFEPAYRNDDLEEDTRLLRVESFKTKKAAKEFIKAELSGKKDIKKCENSGTIPSYYYYYTGNKWINENSGEEREECYIYKLTKV